MREFELVLPAYNESKNLPGLIRRAVLEARAAGFSPERFQLVVVNNGSTDDSAPTLENIKAEWGDWFRVVTVAENKGYGFGVFTGLKSTDAEFVGWSHADLQCDPKDAFEALSLAKAEPKSMAKGFRRGRNGRDRFVTNVFEFLARLFLGVRVKEINAQPKVFPAALLSEIQQPPLHYGFDLYVLYRAIKANYRIVPLRVVFLPRIHGFSKWSATFFSRYKMIAKMVRYLLELRVREGRV